MATFYLDQWCKGPFHFVAELDLAFGHTEIVLVIESGLK